MQCGRLPSAAPDDDAHHGDDSAREGRQPLCDGDGSGEAGGRVPVPLAGPFGRCCAVGWLAARMDDGNGCHRRVQAGGFTF